MFDERTLENFIVQTFTEIGWEYIPSTEIPREANGVLIESMLKEALIRLNPEIASNPDFADTVIYKLRALIINATAHDLVSYNERFKKLTFEENSYPFGVDGRMIPIRFFGIGDDINLNSFVITSQWAYPRSQTGKVLDIVLFINGFPMVIGELKTPSRSAITWLDC
jgi:type I restriction enzyme R subunit